MTTKLIVNGMISRHCQRRIKSELMKLDGIYDVTVNLENKCVEICSDRAIQPLILKEVLEKAGYTVQEIDGNAV